MRTRHRDVNTLLRNPDFSKPVRNRDALQFKLLSDRSRNVEKGIDAERKVGCI